MKNILKYVCMCKNIIVLKIFGVCIILFFYACNPELKPQKIEISAENYPGKEIFVSFRGQKDTISLNDEGVFLYYPKGDLPEFARIEIPGLKNDIVLLVDSL